MRYSYIVSWALGILANNILALEMMPILFVGFFSANNPAVSSPVAPPPTTRIDSASMTFFLASYVYNNLSA